MEAKPATAQGFAPLAAFLTSPEAKALAGPVAILLLEDATEAVSTLEHQLQIGFRHILALSTEPLTLPEPLNSNRKVIRLRFDTRKPSAYVRAVSQIFAAVPEGTWLHYGFNAEYLFFPFCETRSVGELVTFHAEERRDAMLGYVIDLYTPDLALDPDRFDRHAALFDRSGYFALGRRNSAGDFLERQLDFHGGLRWRFEEHIAPERRRIDRIPLFRSAKNLRLLPDHRFSDEEYNTYSCPWHHNLTCAMASFRAARALSRNPGSRDDAHGLVWRNSEPFAWSSQQLMDLGLMEPGQWF